MADRSDEADSIASALRGVGLSVLTCDVVALPERATRVEPVAILVDLEQANARLAIERLLEQKSGEPPELDGLLIVLGTKALAGDLGLRDVADVDVLERPVDVGELAALLQQRLGHLSLRGLEEPPSSLGSMPLASESDAALLSDFPAIAGLPEVAGILPELGSAPGMPPSAGELSPEIEALLDASAQRVAETDPDVGTAAFAGDVPVPPEMMAMVDDLLAPEQSPETQGGMSLAAMLGRPMHGGGPLATTSTGSVANVSGPRGHSPTGGDPESEPVAPGSEPSFDSFGSGTRADASAASSSGGSDPPQTGLQTSVADEQTNVPHPSTQVGSPASGYLASTALASSEQEEASSDRSSDTGPPGPYGLGRYLGDPPGPPTSPRTPHEHELAGGPGGLTDPAPRAAGAAWDPRVGSQVPMTAVPSTAATTMRGYDAEGAAYGMRRPSTRPPQHLPSDRPPESAGYRAEPIPQTRPRSGLDPGAPRLRDTAPPNRGSYAPLEDLEAPPHAELPNQGDPIELLAQAVRTRVTGALVLSDSRGERVRRILMRDGDISNAASDHPDDALIVFLVDRGDLSPEVARTRSPRLPHTGRHAAAALIANGFLGQDDLWPVLRSHAEWIIGRALTERPARCQRELEPPERLRAEPNVFGGAAGVEILLESVRRVLSPAEAYARLGGPEALIDEGINAELLAESALNNEEMDVVRGAPGMSVVQLLSQRGEGFAPVLYALAALGILRVRARSNKPVDTAPPHQGIDPLDVDAVRRRVGARLALVHDADYFALLGVPVNATGYDIRRAYLELRRTFEPNRLITGATMDLRGDAELIVEVLDEAYEILRDTRRRDRYRRAIEATRRV